MRSTPLLALGATLVTSLALAASPAASAATPTKCSKLHGKDLATGSVVRVVRLKLPTLTPRGANAGTENRTGLFSCSLPNGPVHQIANAGQSYFKGQGKAPVESFGAKIGVSAGRFVTVIETDETLMGESFLTERVVNAATGKRLYAYLKTSSEEGPVAGASPLRTLLGTNGTLVGLFPTFDSTGDQKRNKLVAFTGKNGQTLDSAENGAIVPASITLTGNVVTWTDAGVAKSATLTPTVSPLTY